jgi:hypothetical protein
MINLNCLLRSGIRHISKLFSFTEVIKKSFSESELTLVFSAKGLEIHFIQLTIHEKKITALILPTDTKRIGDPSRIQPLSLLKHITSERIMSQVSFLYASHSFDERLTLTLQFG